LGETLEELPYTRQLSKVVEEDSENDDSARVTSLIAMCHDGHQEVLAEEEKRLRAATAK